jgi:hypothetical protein
MSKGAYARALARGKCPNCGRDLVPGLHTCEKCRVKQADETVTGTVETGYGSSATRNQHRNPSLISAHPSGISCPIFAPGSMLPCVRRRNSPISGPAGLRGRLGNPAA